jgi:hypothetical protein
VVVCPVVRLAQHKALVVITEVERQDPPIPLVQLELFVLFGLEMKDLFLPQEQQMNNNGYSLCF